MRQRAGARARESAPVVYQRPCGLVAWLERIADCKRGVASQAGSCLELRSNWREFWRLAPGWGRQMRLLKKSALWSRVFEHRGRRRTRGREARYPDRGTSSDVDSEMPAPPAAEFARQDRRCRNVGRATDGSKAGDGETNLGTCYEGASAEDKTTFRVKYEAMEGCCGNLNVGDVQLRRASGAKIRPGRCGHSGTQVRA